MRLLIGTFYTTSFISMMTFMIAAACVQGISEMNAPVAPVLIMFGVGFVFLCISLYLKAYVDWKIAENNRIRRNLNKYRSRY